jgi:putative component of membrane protein insertase Oxa1/YidC/SpoIIIJ protein YidD
MRFKVIVMFILWPADRGLALLAWLGVLWYRRWISPHKGFDCAHGALTTEPSCSAVGLQAFGEKTFSEAIPIILAQFSRCRSTYARYQNDLINDANTHLAQFGALAATGVVIGCCPGCGPGGGDGPLHHPGPNEAIVSRQENTPAVAKQDNTPAVGKQDNTPAGHIQISKNEQARDETT